MRSFAASVTAGFHVPVARRATRASRRSEDGQVFVIFAGGLVAMLLAVGLVIDGGMAFVNRREGQNVADLAAIAGTKMVADHYTDGGRSGAQVYGAIHATVTDNGCVPSGSTNCTWTAEYVRPQGNTEVSLGAVLNGGSVPSTAQGVRVSVTRLPETFFLRLAGRDSWEVVTRATALTAELDGLPPSGVLPIAIDPPNHNFTPGQVYNLTAGKDGPGNFSFLSWGGTNDAPSLADSICNPDNPELSFPAWVVGDPGKTNSSLVRDCLSTWEQNGGTVLIPTWERVRGQGNNFEFRITGLAAVVLLAHDSPAVDSITARFVEYYPLPNIQAGWGGPPSAGSQVYFLGLIR